MEKNKKKRIYFMPKTRIGKVSFWIVIVAFVSIFVNYWLSIANILVSSSPFPGFLMMIFLIASGIVSFVSVIKYKDYSILLFLSCLIGLLGIAFAIGEIAFPH